MPDTYASDTILATEKAVQRERYETLAPRFKDVLEQCLQFQDESMMTETWSGKCKNYIKENDPPPWDFIMRFSGDMFPLGIWYPVQEMASGQALFSGREEYEQVCQEDLIGNPIMAYDGREEIKLPPLTSFKTISSINELGRIKTVSGFNVREKDHLKVIEWGGGYGNMAKCVWRMRRDGQKISYGLIDTPFFCAIQWLYLSCIFGEDLVYVAKEATTPWAEDKLSIIPAGLIQDIQPDAGYTADLFIALYSLSESSEASQKLVLSRDWFSAPHIILGYQPIDDRFPTAPWLGDQMRATRVGVVTDEKAEFAHVAFV
jgi:hypothetical protein